jgi:Domain of unknown function (DUF5615)
MSIIRLYLDEDAMNRRLVEALRGRGVDLTTPGETITTGLSDEQQLILAHSQGRVFYTFNVGDFCQLHSQFLMDEREHAGIVISSQDYPVGEQMRRLLNLIANRSAESMANQLVFLSAYSPDI